MFRSFLLASLALAVVTLPATAHMAIENAYARSTNPVVAAIYFELRNHSEVDDRIIEIVTDAAERAEQHTHVETDGIMRMVEVEEGFMFPQGETRVLQPGGDHIMLMGLTQPVTDGDTIQIVLIFEHALPVTIDAVVDNDRPVDHGGMQSDHMDHGAGDTDS